MQFKADAVAFFERVRQTPADSLESRRGLVLMFENANGSDHEMGIMVKGLVGGHSFFPEWAAVRRTVRLNPAYF
jgi:hypothetical protein